ncbi:hypothetical protein Q0M94_13790 [Deinococcus radiomollis]|uniref:hypothetical protein n=1 Tax=Deinococcus radiomollis TaxID=468916 RepID=UPI003891D3D9
MKKFILFLPLTAALITACGGGLQPAPAATLSTLTLSGVSAPLQISGNAKLVVTATGSDGQPFAGTPVFTSSDSNVVSVAADGTLNVRHLSVAPVTLTVSEGGKNATLNVTTYGLDAAGGTFSNATTTANGKLGSYFSVVFRNADGSKLAADTQVTIQGPANFNAGATVSGTTYATTTLNNYDSFWNASVPSVSGSYTATATVAGVVYRKSFTVDATSALPRPTGVNLSNTASGFTVSGALPTGAANINVVVYNDTDTLRFSSDLTSLPYSGTWNTPLPKGTYHTGTYATSFTGTSGAAFPDQINGSFAYFADLVVP